MGQCYICRLSINKNPFLIERRTFIRIYDNDVHSKSGTYWKARAPLINCCVKWSRKACYYTGAHFVGLHLTPEHFLDYLVSLLEFNCFTQSRLVTFKARLYLSLPEQKSISEILKVLGRICLPRYTVLNCKGNLTTIRPSNKIVALTGCSQGNLCLFLTEQSLF